MWFSLPHSVGAGCRGGGTALPGASYVHQGAERQSWARCAVRASKKIVLLYSLSAATLQPAALRGQSRRRRGVAWGRPTYTGPGAAREARLPQTLAGAQVPAGLRVVARVTPAPRPGPAPPAARLISALPDCVFIIHALPRDCRGRGGAVHEPRSFPSDRAQSSTKNNKWQVQRRDRLHSHAHASPVLYFCVPQGGRLDMRT